MLTLIESKLAVEPLFDPDMTSSGLYIPDTAKSRANQGIVKYIGPNVKNVQIGDHVLFGGYTGTTVHLEGEGVLIIVPEEFIQAILHDDVLIIPGLYCMDKKGNYFNATFETAIKLVAETYRESEIFRQRREWRLKKGHDPRREHA